MIMKNKTYQIKKQTARNRDDLLEAQYKEQEVSKEANDYTDEIIKKLNKYGITIRTF